MPRPRDTEPTPPELAPIDRLRPHRSVRDRAAGLGDAFAAEARTHKRTASRLDHVSELWDAMCPPGLIERTAPRAVARGVLTIAASDAPTRYAIDRALHAGLEREIIRACPMTVRRVRVVLASDS